jgi:hypothetical protein
MGAQATCKSSKFDDWAKFYGLAVWWVSMVIHREIMFRSIQGVLGIKSDRQEQEAFCFHIRRFAPGELHMSRTFIVNSLAFTLALVCSLTATADIAIEHSLKKGDSIGVFYVTKVAGAEDDGVEVGQDLCYRCRYGSSPMVIVFVRETGGMVPELLRQLDAAVAQNKDSGFKALVTLVGEDVSLLKEAAIEIARQTDVKELPVVVAKDTKTGPLNYKLPRGSAVTIVIGKDSQVVTTRCFAADKVDIAAVMKEVRQVLE